MTPMHIIFIFLLLIAPSAFAGSGSVYVLPTNAGASPVTGGWIAGTGSATSVASVDSTGAARVVVKMPYRFGTPAWEAAMSVTQAYTETGQAAKYIAALRTGAKFVPGVNTLMLAAAAGSVGYDFYSWLKQKSITLHPDGSLSVAGSIYSCAFYNGTLTGTTGAAACGSYTFSNNACYTPGYVGSAYQPSAFCSVLPASVPAQTSDLENLQNQPMSANVEADIANVYAQVAAQNLLAPIPNGFPSYGLPQPLIQDSPASPPTVTTNPDGSTLTSTTKEEATIIPPALSGDPYLVNTKTIQQNVTTASGLAPQTQTITTPGAVVNPNANPNAAPANGLPAGFQMPTDYNREATQQRMASSVASIATLDTAIQQSTSQIASAVVVVPSAASAVDTTAQDITNLTNDSSAIPKFDPAALSGNLPLPTASGTCSAMPLSFMGANINLDFCSMVAYLHPLINYMFVFMFGILCFRTAFAKQEI